MDDNNIISVDDSVIIDGKRVCLETELFPVEIKRMTFDENNNIVFIKEKLDVFK